MQKISSIITLVLMFCASSKSDAQCDTLRFNTTSDSGWKTCTTNTSPNEDRGISSWLHYDLGNTHQLDESWLWNYNDYNDLESGVTQFVIDYINPNGSWTELGMYDVEPADGTSTYNGQEGPNFGGIITSEVLVTFLDNGGSQCFGIGEWKISAIEAEISSIEVLSDSEYINLYPSPTSHQLMIALTDTQCNECRVSIVDHLGRQVMSLPMKGTTLTVNVKQLRSGIYTACVESESNVICEKFSVLTQ